MQEVILPLCAAAGVAAALVLGRMRGGAPPKSLTESDHLESERSILLKSISKLEKDPGYAAERDALLPAYKNRLAEIQAALAAKAHQGTAVPAGERGGGLPGTKVDGDGGAVGVAVPDAAGSAAAGLKVDDGDGGAVGVAVPDAAGSAAAGLKVDDGGPGTASVRDGAAGTVDDGGPGTASVRDGAAGTVEVEPEAGGGLPGTKVDGDGGDGAVGVAVPDAAGSAAASRKVVDDDVGPGTASVRDGAARQVEPEAGGGLPGTKVDGDGGDGAVGVAVPDAAGSAAASLKVDDGDGGDGAVGVAVPDAAGSAAASLKVVDDDVGPGTASVRDGAARQVEPEAGGGLPGTKVDGDGGDGAVGVAVPDAAGSAAASRKVVDDDVGAGTASVRDGAAGTVEVEPGGGLPGTKVDGDGGDGAVGVAVPDVAGSAAASRKVVDDDVGPGTASVRDGAARPTAEHPKTDRLAPEGRPDAPTATSQDAEPHPTPPKDDIVGGGEPKVESGPDGGDGPDSDEDDLEKIKGDIARAISKLERAESE